MYSEVFLTQFWPACGVHFTFERLISSWYTYEIKIHVHIKYLLPQVWNKIIVHLTTYQSQKWNIERNTCTLPKTRKIHKVEVRDFKD